MSLIHEALKKAERQRQLGKAPTLDTPVYTSQRRGRWILPILLLLIVAGAMAWVLLWPTATPPQTVAEASAPATSLSSHKAVAPAASAGRIARSSPVAQSDRQAGSEKTAPVAQKGDRATPKTVRDPVTRRDVKAPGSARARPPAKPAVVAPPSPPPANVKPADKPKAAAADQVAAAGKTAGSARQKTQLSKPNQAAEPAGKKRKKLPMYWDLPYAVRSELPVFEVSMHVYSADAADRFVILNGERRVAGDELKAGIKLIAVRPDGIEMERDGQRFLVPRNGGY